MSTLTTNNARVCARLGVVYGYRTYRVNRTTGMILDGTVEVGYVGQTVQELADRDDQHRGRKPGPNGEPVKCQPFSDVIHGDVFIIEADVPVGRLDEREAHHIAKLMPVYNHQLQTKDNPNRIPISEARRHRDARDRAKGLEPRQWPPFSTQRTARPAPAGPTRQPQRAPSRPSAATRRRRNVILGYGFGWVLQAALWWPLLALAAHRWQIAAPGRVWPVLAAGLAGAPLMFGLRRRHRKTAWIVLAVATVILAGLATR